MDEKAAQEPRRVLVVDDEPVMRMLLTRLLAKKGGYE
ncbi:MAG: two-component system response regulator, partial [Desulfobulbaceae bacterium]